MVKRIPCRVVSSGSYGAGYQNSAGGRPPMLPGDSSGLLGEVNGEGEQECFPMGMFVDIIIGD